MAEEGFILQVLIGFQSVRHLSFQAEVNIKIEIIWERTIWEKKGDDEYETEEYYFESEKEDYFSDDDGPNYDPRNDPYWEEFLEDFES